MIIGLYEFEGDSPLRRLMSSDGFRVDDREIKDGDIVFEFADNSIKSASVAQVNQSGVNLSFLDLSGVTLHCSLSDEVKENPFTGFGVVTRVIFDPYDSDQRA